MVTGVETAGIVLAVFPLLQEILAAYKEGGKTFTLWWRFSKTLSRLDQAISYQESILVSTLLTLLLPIVGSESGARQLISEPFDRVDSAWKRPALDKAVRDRLGLCYDSFCKTLTCMNESLADFRTLLGLDQETQDRILASFRTEPGSRLVGWQYLFTSLRITYENNDLLEVVQGIERLNLQLHSLLSRSAEVTTHLQNLEGQASRSVLRARHHYNYLFHLLSREWPCSCANVHAVRVVVSHDTNAGRDGLRTPNGSSTAFRAFVRLHHGVASTKGTLLQAKLSLDNTEESQDSSPGAEGNLCRRLLHCSGPAPDLWEAGSQLQIQEIERVPPLKYPLRSVSLEEWRATGPRHNLLRLSTLSIPDKLSLSLNAVSFFMHAYGTPWLKDWDLSAFDAPSKGLFGNYFNRDLAEYATIYLRRDFPSQATPEAQSQVPPSHGLLQLAIFLGEICFGKVLEDFAPEAPVHRDQSASDRAHAIIHEYSWLMDVDDLMGSNFSAPIRACIALAMSTPPSALESPAFWQSVHDLVFKPICKLMSGYMSIIG